MFLIAGLVYIQVFALFKLELRVFVPRGIQLTIGQQERSASLTGPHVLVKVMRNKEKTCNGLFVVIDIISELLRL